MKRLESRGIGLFWMLLGFAAAGIVVFIIWFMLFGNKNSSSNSSNQQSNQSSATPTPTATTTPSPTTTADPNLNYLEIPQAGFKIPTNDFTKKDIEYSIQTAQGTTYKEVILISTSLKKKLSDQYPELAGSPTFTSAKLAIVPTADFKNGYVEYPGVPDGKIGIDTVNGSFGDYKLVVINGTLSEIGDEYIQFVASVRNAAKSAAAL